MTAGPLAPQRLAALHVEAFDTPWDAEAFETLLRQPGVAALGDDDGFILLRVAADEAEILTLAVRPAARRRGHARGLVGEAAAVAAAAGAARLFLEVAEDNVAARRLYGGLGFAPAGRRPRYYARPGGPPADALLLSLDLAAARPPR